MYNYIYDNYSNEQIMYFTLFILFIADLPIIFFTFLDIYKFNFLNKYRINYNCYRKYPNKLEIIDGAKHSLYNLFAIIIPITTIGIFIANYINYFPYKMNRELPHYTTVPYCVAIVNLCIIISMRIIVAIIMITNITTIVNIIISIID